MRSLQTLQAALASIANGANWSARASASGDAVDAISALIDERVAAALGDAAPQAAPDSMTQPTDKPPRDLRELASAYLDARYAARSRDDVFHETAELVAILQRVVERAANDPMAWTTEYIPASKLAAAERELAHTRGRIRAQEDWAARASNLAVDLDAAKERIAELEAENLRLRAAALCQGCVETQRRRRDL